MCRRMRRGEGAAPGKFGVAIGLLPGALAGCTAPVGASCPCTGSTVDVTRALVGRSVFGETVGRTDISSPTGEWSRDLYADVCSQHAGGPTPRASMIVGTAVR